jgi:hypothetical protein
MLLKAVETGNLCLFEAFIGLFFVFLSLYFHLVTVVSGHLFLSKDFNLFNFSRIRFTDFFKVQKFLFLTVAS